MNPRYGGPCVCIIFGFFAAICGTIGIVLIGILPSVAFLGFGGLLMTLGIVMLLIAIYSERSNTPPARMRHPVVYNCPTATGNYPAQEQQQDDYPPVHQPVPKSSLQQGYTESVAPPPSYDEVMSTPSAPNDISFHSNDIQYPW